MALNSGVRCAELPINLFSAIVAVGIPDGNSRTQGRFVADTARQALFPHHAKGLYKIKSGVRPLPRLLVRLPVQQNIDSAGPPVSAARRVIWVFNCVFNCVFNWRAAILRVGRNDLLDETPGPQHRGAAILATGHCRQARCSPQALFRLRIGTLTISAGLGGQ